MALAAGLTIAPAIGRPGAPKVPRLLVAAWGALFLNVLAFSLLPMLVPVPARIGQLATQGALVVALLLALTVNRKGVLRPNGFLVLLTLMAVLTLMVSIHNQFVMGSTFRAVRFLTFVTVLWLLSPWFGRRDMMLLRCHRACMAVTVATVLVGIPLAPGKAFSYGGRLSGVIWPIPPTQVAHYAAVLLGTSVLLWTCQVISGRNAIVSIVASAGVLLGTHTRTALVACAVALVCAGASLFLGNKRVRRTSLWGAVVVAGTLGVFASEITKWALRGQDAQEVGNLTGRTEVWSEVVHVHRTVLGDLFGSGMSNLSWNGLPIDSNWVGTYLDQGWCGILLDAALLLLLLVLLLTRERSPQRAIGLFLVMYCLFASITETGMSNPSPYLLDLTVAAGLILPRQVAAR